MNTIKGLTIAKNASLQKYNTYKIESKAKYFITVKDITSLQELLKYLKKNQIKYFILGAGSNIILDEYFGGAIIKLSGLDYVNIVDNQVTVGAGTMMNKITIETIKQNLTGLEWAINIPGTIGGSINNNAGAYNSEIFDNLVSLKVLDSNFNIQILSKNDIKYNYRSTNIKDLGLIIIEATFILKPGNKEEAKELIKSRCERRRETQPLDKPSAGSVFRNPNNDYAGRLIEAVGLKGYQIGGAMISKKHANFIVNNGGATSKDIKNLIKLVKEEVKKQFGINLILEQEIIDWE